MKKWMAVLAAVLCVILAAAVSADTNYTEKTVKVFGKEDTEEGELTLRFYEATPNVAYIGLHEYWDYVNKTPLTMTANADGTALFRNGQGGELTCDPAAGTLFSADWPLFVNPPLPLEGTAKGLKDVDCQFVRITEIIYEGDPKPVTIDLAKYGIGMYADEKDVYLPVSTVSNLLTDIATNHMRYNGESLYALRMDLTGKIPDSLHRSDMQQKQLDGAERPADQIKQCYADLCLDFDYFFGHPGVAPLDSALAEKGLDQALTDLGQEGEEIRAGLLSNDLRKYLAAKYKLFLVYLSDGHTVILDGNFINSDHYESKLDYVKTIGESLSDLTKSETTMKQILHMMTGPQRTLAWGEQVYIEHGNTAILRLDTFMPDEAAWDKYYKGEGGFPEDAVGKLVSGLKKASENPDIRNVIFDLTCNDGGSSDVCALILALTTGQDHLYGINKLTGQKMLIRYEADTNFDGIFDEKDKEIRYDFHYGVLVTRHAFSCGNYFPFVMQEGGAVLIGEPSSGGSCSVQIGTDYLGFGYMMSSAQWQLTDAEGASVEGGCKIDLPIETKTNRVVNALVSLLGVDDDLPSFMAFFDTDRLDQMMNEWFGRQAEEVPAA